MAEYRRRGARMILVAGFVMLACGLFMIIIWFTDPDRRGAPIGVTFIGSGAAFIAVAGAIARKAATAGETAPEDGKRA